MHKMCCKKKSCCCADRPDFLRSRCPRTHARTHPRDTRPAQGKSEPGTGTLYRWSWLVVKWHIMVGLFVFVRGCENATSRVSVGAVDIHQKISERWRQRRSPKARSQIPSIAARSSSALLATLALTLRYCCIAAGGEVAGYHGC